MNNNLQSDEEIERVFNNYMNGIKVPESLGDRVMNNYNEIKSNGIESNEKKSNGIKSNEIEPNEKSNKPNRKRFSIKILAGVASILIVVGVFVGIGVNNNMFNNVTFLQQSDLKLAKQDNGKDVVYSSKEYYYKDSSSNYSVSYRIPVINLNSEVATSINKKIQQRYGDQVNEIIDEIETEKANNSKNPLRVLTNSKTSKYQFVNYEYYENNDVLSLVISSKIASTAQLEPTTEYQVYNINFQKEAIVENDKLLEKVEMSKQDCKMYITNNIEAYYKNHFPDWSEDSKDAYMQTARLYENSDDIVGDLFIGKDGKLMALVYYYEKPDFFPVRKVETIINAYKKDEIETTTNTQVSKTSNSTGTISYECPDFKTKLPKSWEGKYKVENGYLSNNSGKYYKFTFKENNEYLFEIRIEKNFNAEIPQCASYIGRTSNGYYYIYYKSELLPQNGEDTNEVHSEDIFMKETVKSIKTGKEKEFFAKDIITLDGSMYKSKMYYISEENNICLVDYSDDINVEIIANCASRLVYNQDKNIIEAYPLGDSFMNNICRQPEEIVFNK